jgi:hypothetical protein
VRVRESGWVWNSTRETFIPLEYTSAHNTQHRTHTLPTILHCTTPTQPTILHYPLPTSALDVSDPIDIGWDGLAAGTHARAVDEVAVVAKGHLTEKQTHAYV